MLIPVDNVGQFGIIRDTRPDALPLNAWSEGRNVRMYEGAVEKFLGHSEPFGSPTVAPYWVMPIQTTSTVYWIYAGLGKVYLYDGVTHTDITRTSGGDYSATADENWTGGVLGGVAFLNNGIDDPQILTPVQASTDLVALTSWPASTKCKAMRAFKQFLIAMNTTESSTEFTRKIKWSNSAAFNAVPTSWDETDATEDAGEYELSDTQGAILDGAELRDSFIIYKEDSIWGMQFIGPPFIWRFYKVSITTGMLANRCMTEFFGGHFVFGINDLFVTDGQNIKPILDKRMRRFLYNDIDADNYKRSFVVQNVERNEIWACYPASTASFCNRAVVWNWRDDTVSVRDLPDVAHIAQGIVDPGSTGDAWADDSDSWDTDATVWGTNNFNPALRKLLMADPGNTNLYKADDTNQENGVDMLSRIERTGLFADSIDAVKMCRGLRLNMEGSGPVDIYVGSQFSADDPIQWNGPFSYNPMTDYKIDCRVSGRLLGVKIESESDISWKLNSYSWDLAPAGKN